MTLWLQNKAPIVVSAKKKIDAEKNESTIQCILLWIHFHNVYFLIPKERINMTSQNVVF